MITAFELRLLDWIAAHLRCGFLDSLVPLITRLGDGGAVWILLTLVLLIVPKTRKAGLAVFLALILDLLLCNLLIKPLAARPRPFAFRDLRLLIPPPPDFSFPSGHTAASFAAVSALFFTKSSRWLWVSGLILGTLIALSRLYLYVHYPTDILGGVLVGVLCGVFGSFLAKKRWNLSIFRKK